jgi:hypothetical protein
MTEEKKPEITSNTEKQGGRWKKNTDTETEQGQGKTRRELKT